MPCPDLKSENTNVRSFRGGGNLVSHPSGRGLHDVVGWLALQAFVDQVPEIARPCAHFHVAPTRHAVAHGGGLVQARHQADHPGPHRVAVDRQFVGQIAAQQAPREGFQRALRQEEGRLPGQPLMNGSNQGSAVVVGRHHGPLEELVELGFTCQLIWQQGQIDALQVVATAPEQLIATRFLIRNNHAEAAHAVDEQRTEAQRRQPHLQLVDGAAQLLDRPG